MSALVVVGRSPTGTRRGASPEVLLEHGEVQAGVLLEQDGVAALLQPGGTFAIPQRGSVVARVVVHQDLEEVDPEVLLLPRSAP